MTAPGGVLTSRTYLPDEDRQQVAKVFGFLAAHEAARGVGVAPRYLLVGAEEGDQVEIPASVHHILAQVIDALQAGRAVTVAPTSTTLTTQQAADLLGVSRPTVVRLIDAGHLPADQVGNRRRLPLAEVLRYREARRRAQYAALDQMAADFDDDDDVEQEIARAREARKVVAARRRAARGR